MLKRCEFTARTEKMFVEFHAKNEPESSGFYVCGD